MLKQAAARNKSEKNLDRVGKYLENERLRDTRKEEGSCGGAEPGWVSQGQV